MNALSPSNEDSHRAPTPQCDRYAENERGSCLHNAGGYRQPPCRCRSEEHTSELQSRLHLVCRLLLEKNKNVVSQDLTPTEQARTIATLLEDLKVTAGVLAKLLGRRRTDLVHSVRLLELPDEAARLTD